MKCPIAPNPNHGLRRCIPISQPIGTPTGRIRSPHGISDLHTACPVFHGITPAASTAVARPKVMLEDENGYGFIRQDPKPRTKSVTEIRGPYYSVMGKRYLEDVLET